MKASPKLSNASKMPCKSWSLPAVTTCQGAFKSDGVTLVDACQGCYATKGRYKFGAVKDLREYNMEDWKRSGWVDAMVKAIGKGKFFRWFDSGDIENEILAEKIVRVCKATPNTKHWIPTRTYKIPSIQAVLDKMPENVVVRYSSDSVIGGKVSGSHTSTIIQSEDNFIPSKGYSLCRAFARKGKCKDCRACWSKKVHTVAYIAH